MHPGVAASLFQMVRIGPKKIGIANRHETFMHVLLPREEVVFLADVPDLTIERVNGTEGWMTVFVRLRD